MILNTLNQEIMKNRRVFDANSQDDLNEYSYFLKHNKWESICPFFLEWPYLTIPDMLKDKIIKNMLLK